MHALSLGIQLVLTSVGHTGTGCALQDDAVPEFTTKFVLNLGMQLLKSLTVRFALNVSLHDLKSRSWAYPVTVVLFG